MTDWPDARAFAEALLGKGIEFVLRRSGRLHVWPARAYPHLTDAEKTFIREHRAELRELAASRALPETTVVWCPATEANTSAPVGAPSGPPCIYCGNRPCVGIEHPAFATLHSQDPQQQARLNREAYDALLRRL